MQEWIEKADVLIEALPYIQQFRGEVIVVKFGGSAMEDPAHIEGVLEDVTFMECVGMLPIVVHGGGKAISRGLQAAGLASAFVKGLRVTCARTVEVVERVMKQELNPQIVATLNRLGARAEGLHGDRLFKVNRKQAVDPETGAVLDWGFVGEPRDVAVDLIRDLLKRNVIPVITPLGMGDDGRVYNVNADVAAMAVAKALQARKLAFLSDVPGLLRKPDDPDSVIATLKVSEAGALMEEGVIGGGMLPKVASCLEAIHAGVRKVHMIDGRMPHSLLLEIFTNKGVGTEIIKDE